MKLVGLIFADDDGGGGFDGEGCLTLIFACIIIAVVSCVYGLFADEINYGMGVGISVVLIIAAGVMSIVCRCRDEEGKFTACSIVFIICCIMMAVCSCLAEPAECAKLNNISYKWLWFFSPGVVCAISLIKTDSYERRWILICLGVYAFSAFITGGMVMSHGKDMEGASVAISLPAPEVENRGNSHNSVTQGNKDEDSLTVAVHCGDVDAIGTLLEEQRHWDSAQGLLQESALSGNAVIVEALVTHGVDPNIYKDEKGKTLLHLAVAAESLETVQALLKGKADPNARNHEKRTPIYSAIYQQNEAIIKVLLEAGAKTKIEDKWSITPLEFAKERKCKASIISLLKNNRK